MTSVPAAITPPEVTLNAGQLAAAEGFFEFLFTDEREMRIKGPGGVGKTFLMSYMIDIIMPNYFDTCKLMSIEPQYDEVMMTATTNKAASVLAEGTGRPTKTIQSFMNLKVRDDITTGQSFLTKQLNWKVHFGKIIFIDEASMVDTPLDKLIAEGTQDCKIVWVGDHCQLAPVTEKLSPVYKRPMREYELTEPMRNSGQPALMSLCNQLRETVKTGIFKPIQVIPGVIDLLDETGMEQALHHFFPAQTPNVRVLAYTNKRVVDYNDYIRDIRQHPTEYQVGDILVNNTAIRMPARMLSVEEEVEIIHQDPNTIQKWVEDGVMLEVRLSTLVSKATGDVFLKVPVPVDREHFSALMAHYTRTKNWKKKFELKDNYPDLRPREAATAYKAQGSTYDVIMVDLNDVCTCRNPDQVARLLYVIFSRPRHRAIMYGSIPEKFGGLIA